VTIKNLGVGDYVLKIKNIGKFISIKVHRGTFWETDNFILKRTCLFENIQASKNVKIYNVKGIYLYFIICIIVEEGKQS
jgi:hypothetical protein